MKVGIALANLGASQLNYYLVRRANALLAAEPSLDVTGFVESQASNPLPANFALMPLAEAWGYDGPVVATTFMTARRLRQLPGPAARLFYVWDLEWLRPWARRGYREWADVYRDPSLALVARSEEHAAVIADCWNRPVRAVVEDCELKTLLALLQGK